MKYLVPLNLSQQELQNARVQNLASAPSSPVVGQMYYDTGLGKFGTYNGTTWDYMGTSGATGDFSSNTATSVDGEVVVFSGTAGKTGKRATGSGIAKLTSGVLGTATAGTDYYAPGGTDVAVADGGTGTSTLSGILKGNGTSAVTGSATLTDVGTPTADFSMGSHKITSLTDPTSAQDAATKAYVDAAAAGIDWKASVRAIATTNGTLSTAYANGQTVDGVTLATGNRILLAGQTTGADNGIYTVNATGAPTRATDADTSAEVTAGIAVFVEEGTTDADTGWVLTTNGTITLGTTALTFTQFTGLGSVTAGSGLAKSGNTLSIENSGVLTIPHGGTGLATLPAGLLKGAGTGAITAATGGTDYVRPFKATIGDGTTTAIAVTHSLGTQDVIAQVRDASTNAVVECDITQTSTSVTTLTFTVAPATNAYKVVIIG